MKLLFYISNIGGGGAARVMCNIANEICTNHQVVFVANFSSEHEYELRQEIVRYNLEEKESQDKALKKNIKRVVALRRVIKAVEPDASIAFMGENNVRLLFAAKGLQTKTFISVRNDPNKEYPSSKFPKFTDYIYRKADGIIFQTENAKQFFSEIVQNKSKIIFNQVESRFYQQTTSLGDMIIACGRLSPQKNYAMMLEAFKHVLVEFPTETLVVYGEGALKEKLIRYTEELGIKESVIFMGYATDMVENYKKAKMLILSSDYEGMPNVVLEALASSVPVISTDCPCGGPKMVIKEGSNGMLVPVGDKNALANAIISLLKNPDKNLSMKKNAYDSAQAFSSDKVIAEWLEFILKEGV